MMTKEERDAILDAAAQTVCNGCRNGVRRDERVGVHIQLGGFWVTMCPASGIHDLKRNPVV